MDSNEIKKLQSDRLRYLEKAYHESKGNSNAFIGWKETGQSLGFDDNYSISLMHWLREEGFVKPITFAHFQITNYGMKMIEDAITRPEEPAGPFIAYNSIYVGQMINSNIQQGTFNSTQNIIIQKNDVEKINELINKLESFLENLSMETIQRQDILADIETIKAQTRSSKPKKQIIIDALSSISGILQVLPTAQILTTEIIPQITQILNSLGIH